MLRRRALLAGTAAAALLLGMGWPRRGLAASVLDALSAPTGTAPTGPQPPASKVPRPAAGPTTFPIMRTEAQWRAMLTPAQFHILRQDGTEQPYSSPLLTEHRTGLFTCAGCGQPVFSSTAKYESNTGWPSFFQPVPDAVGTREDRSIPLLRTEVHCTRCGSHLGHVFEDGPPPTYLRYCMDGLALVFVPL